MPEIFCRQGNKCVYYHTKESSMIDQKNIDELKIKVEFLNKLFKQWSTRFFTFKIIYMNKNVE